jgi:aldose 1-epimerase
MTVELTAGPDRLVLEPAAGGRISALVAAGEDRLVAHPPADVPDELRPVHWGCFLMAPWAGRIAGGELDWDGERHQLRRNAGGHALHGVVFDAAWQVLAVSATSATLALELPAAGWPLGGRLEQRVSLGHGRAELSVTVTAGERSMPVWIGWHPCFRRPEHGDVTVRVDAEQVLATATDLVPTGARVPVDTVTDLRDGPWLGERRLDHVYPLVRGPVTVTWPDLVLDMTMTPPFRTAVVYSRPDLFCVEPQTGWPDALHRCRQGDDAGVHRLVAGATFTATTTWTWQPLDRRGPRA